MNATTSERQHLLRLLRQFVTSASKVHGVSRIAVLGSLTTEKASPKDADVLVTVQTDVDMEQLAVLARRLKGGAQTRNQGADIFLCDVSQRYIGRVCSWRECHWRVACQGTLCGPGNRICDDLQVICLDSRILTEPPLEVWPKVIARGALPKDLLQTVVAGD